MRHHLVLVGLVLLVLLAGASRADEAFPPASFTTVKLGETARGSVDAKSRITQWFCVRVSGIGFLKVKLAGEGENDIDLEVYDEKGNRLAWSNAKEGQEECLVETTTSTDFYLKVKAYGLTPRTAFTLKTEYTDGFPEIKLNETVEGEVTTATPNLIYRVKVEGTGDLIVSIDGEDVTTDVDLKVYGLSDDDGLKALGSSAMAGNEEEVRVNCRIYTWYYLKVIGLNNASKFTLKTEYTDDLEKLGDNALVNGTLSPSCREKVYRTAEPHDGFILFDLEGAADYDMDLMVISGDERYSSVGNYSNEKLLVRPTPGQPLRTVVNVVGDIDKKATFTLNTDVAGTAKPLDVNGTVNDNVTFRTNRIDLYELKPGYAGVLAATLAGDRPGQDLDLYVFKSDGTVLDQSRGNDVSEESLLAPLKAGQTYYLAIVACRSDDENDYTLTCRYNDQSGTVRLQPNDVQPRKLAGNSRQNDFFRVVSPGAGVMALQAQSFESNQDIDLEVVGASGVHRRSESLTGREQVVANVASGEALYPRIWGAGLTADAYYLVKSQYIPVSNISAAAKKPGPDYWGVFAGVQDYQSINDLSYTAGDAVNVYRVFTEGGQMPRDHAVVLIDENASYANLKSAIQQAVSRADEDDILVVFFSGHGSYVKERAEVSDESDGADEMLCCWDSNEEDCEADILDDELREWLSKSKARVNLIVLDSCYSGGFESDLGTRQNMLAFFSSQEDKTSAEASSFQSGVLAHVLTLGLKGEADADANGTVTSEELEDYVLVTMPQFCPVCKGLHPVDIKVCPIYHEPLTGKYRRQHPKTIRILSRDEPVLVIKK